MSFSSQSTFSLMFVFLLINLPIKSVVLALHITCQILYQVSFDFPDPIPDHSESVFFLDGLHLHRHSICFLLCLSFAKILAYCREHCQGPLPCLLDYLHFWGWKKQYLKSIHLYGCVLENTGSLKLTSWILRIHNSQIISCMYTI